MRKILPLSVTLSSLLLSQTVTSLEYKGLLHLSEDVATEISGIHIGDEFDINKIDESLKSFYRQGYFSDIWVSATESGGLVYNFKEKSTISKLEMNGYSSDDEQEALFISVGLRKGDLYDIKKVENAKKRLIKKIESEGYYDTVVEVNAEPKTDSIALSFEVNKGEKIYIQNINFAGADHIDVDELEDALANQEEDALGWLPGLHSGVAHMDQLGYDSFRAKDVYMKNGYLDATVSEPLMRVDSGSYLADVSYQVSEGEQYRIKSIEIVGLVDGLDKDEILDELRLLDGKVFNVDKLRKDMGYIQEQVANLGYAYAKVAPNFNKNEADKTVDIQFSVRAGNKVTINDVIISGNYSTKDRVIRRDIFLAPGDIFNLTDLKDSKSALGRRGYFENIDIEQQRVDESNINLLVKVKETATGSIQAGGGYGSYQGFMLNASLSDRNILGSGMSASLGFDLSKVSTNYSLSINNPRVWDSEYSLGMSIYKNEYEYSTYQHDTFGVSSNIGKRLTRHLYGSLGYSYSENDIDSNGTSTAIISSVFSNEDLNYAKSTISVGLSYDSTDDFFVPREGIILGGNVGYSGVGGDEEFMAYSAKFGLYYGVEDYIDYDLIFRYKLRAKWLQETGHISGPEKLFLGGVSSVRGYEPYSIAPTRRCEEDENCEYKYLGGMKSVVNTIEASIPLSTAAKMRLAFFADYGMIGETNFDEIKRAGYGVSLEWYSPMGPINLVFARAKNPGELDKTSNFEFTMGRKF
ncbi:outer membrane protein assembly factor BamA [Sulfurovum sp. bin170]|uniref:outer membrane protein assembly factor BamA n=1 Tax=Sulfurovum sp. bin170 TaxID=2695268 RepID=UPI0013E0D0C4|nr:outer membrane protein assembly factor BamA [Sulfurovum sp. bin170]NEW59879.1 outer membrane protein assembly factor BamA [Sulfurovum sp. bin170]